MTSSCQYNLFSMLWRPLAYDDIRDVNLSTCGIGVLYLIILVGQGLLPHEPVIPRDICAHVIIILTAAQICQQSSLSHLGRGTAKTRPRYVHIDENLQNYWVCCCNQDNDCCRYTGGDGCCCLWDDCRGVQVSLTCLAAWCSRPLVLLKSDAFFNKIFMCNLPPRYAVQ